MRFFGQKSAIFYRFCQHFWELIKTSQMHHVSKFWLNWTIFSHFGPFLAIFCHFLPIFPLYKYIGKIVTGRHTPSRAIGPIF